jgi:hypothetical protein
VHLVTEGAAFEQILARWNGNSCWFEQVDRHADPAIAETLQSNLKQLTPVKKLQFKDRKFNGGRAPRALQQKIFQVMAKLKEFPVIIYGVEALGADLVENLARADFDKLKVIDRESLSEMPCASLKPAVETGALILAFLRFKQAEIHRHIANFDTSG